MARTAANEHPSIATKTTDSAALLSSFEEAIRLEVAAEMNLTLKRNEYNDLEDEYGHCGKSNPMNDQEYIQCHRLHAAMEEMQTAASRLGENRYKVGIVRRELQKLNREGTEAMETLAAASEDTKVEEGSNRWLVLN